MIITPDKLTNDGRFVLDQFLDYEMYNEVVTANGLYLEQLTAVDEAITLRRMFMALDELVAVGFIEKYEHPTIGRGVAYRSVFSLANMNRMERQ